MKELLNYKQNGLRLFDDPIVVDYTLPKWVNARKGETKTGGNSYFVPTNPSSETTSAEMGDTSNVFITVNNNWSNGIEPPVESGEKVTFDEMAALGLKELNKFINENKNGLLQCLGVSGRYEREGEVLSTPFLAEYRPNDPKATGIRAFFDKVKFLFKKEPTPELDAIQFFTAIKATSKESATGYVNRVSKYLQAIHRASAIGQTALVSKLAREMVGNKYESFLASEGYYYVVEEEDVVKFARKSERGISIDYIKNFVRPIPDTVADAIIKANNLEVFDNYVIMHYDPEGKSYMYTPKEEIKKRDPIVFGVIAGSKKLYYITDWIDDYCDLTLAKFVDTLKISKDNLIKDEIAKEEVKKERAEEKKKAEEEAKQKAKEGAKKEKVKATKNEKKETVKKVETKKKKTTKKNK